MSEGGFFLQGSYPGTLHRGDSCMECFFVCERECFLHEGSGLFCRGGILAIYTQVFFAWSAFDLCVRSVFCMRGVGFCCCYFAGVILAHHSWMFFGMECF